MSAYRLPFSYENKRDLAPRAGETGPILMRSFSDSYLIQYMIGRIEQGESACSE